MCEWNKYRVTSGINVFNNIYNNLLTSFLTALQLVANKYSCETMCQILEKNKNIMEDTNLAEETVALLENSTLPLFPIVNHAKSTREFYSSECKAVNNVSEHL